MRSLGNGRGPNNDWGRAPLHVSAWGAMTNSQNIVGSNADETLTGSAAGDRINGAGGNDSLFGGGGNDLLFGGSGNDILDGGTGDDTLIGGSGADIYQFSGSWGNDVIMANDDTSLDSISFGDNVTLQSLTVSQSGTTVTISAADSGSITIQNWDSGKLNCLQFSDGSKQTISDLCNQVATADETSYALLVGVGDYPGISSDLSGVSYDLSDLKSFLNSDSVWKNSDVTTIKDSQATKNNLTAALNSLSQEVTTGDDVLFYYSGHGYSDGGLACYDREESVAELYTSITAIGDKVGSSGHVSVILDSCYSGALVDYFKAHSSDERYTILTACSSSQYSYDTSSNGLFTHYLFDNAIAGKSADANKDNAITVQEAYDYLQGSAYKTYASVQLYGAGNYVIA